MPDIIQTNEGETIASHENLSEKLLGELIEPGLDLTIDYSELFLDDFIANEALQNIPIIKSFVGVIRSGISIQKFWFGKKLLTFITESNAGKSDLSARLSFKKKIAADPKFGRKVAETLMIHIDRHLEINKTKISARLFCAFIENAITFEEFQNILIMLDALHPKTYNAFFTLAKHNFTINEANRKDIGERDFHIEQLLVNSGFATEPSDWFSGFELTDEGRKLFIFGLKPIIGR